MGTSQPEGVRAPIAAIAAPNVQLLINQLRDGASAVDADQLVIDSLPALLELSGATSAIAARSFGDLAVVAQAGPPLSWADESAHLLADLDTTTCPTVPDAWAEQGFEGVLVHRLPGRIGALVLAWTSGATPTDPRADTGTQLALGLLDASLARLHAEDELVDLSTRVDNAQQLAQMGDYDWHIPTDTNRWSDELYRIYGHEPQSFNASYERFLSHIHPDDRDRIMEIHQQAYATGEPYQMIERIMRPNGDVRYLSSNGQVVMGQEGTPVRMRGTCVDITDRVAAEEERVQNSTRFRSLVEFSPDAILVVDTDGVILQANRRASELLGGDPLGHSIDEILPGSGLRSGPPTESTTATDLLTAGLDGRTLRMDVATARLSDLEDDGLLAIFLQDAMTRLASEELAVHLHEAQLRRRQALEINDNIVQGLTAALYAIELEDTERCATYLQRTLSSARGMIDDLVTPLPGEEMLPQDLVRATASSLNEDKTGRDHDPARG